jgi:hypothetical protein
MVVVDIRVSVGGVVGTGQGGRAAADVWAAVVSRWTCGRGSGAGWQQRGDGRQTSGWQRL